MATRPGKVRKVRSERSGEIGDHSDPPLQYMEASCHWMDSSLTTQHEALST